MSSAAAAWLMTSLDSHPLMVSMVQVASSLPMFLFALPAGALADMVDKRAFLIATEIGVTVIAVLFAAMVSFELVTPASLLFLMFVTSIGNALVAPAWQSVVPQLVPREELGPAIAANSVGINVSRAVGPALGGVITAGLSIATPFWINAVSNLGVIGALTWWRTSPPPPRRLPAERFAGAMRAGVRYARHSLPLRATLYRAVAFFLFASAYWALLPLVTRTQIAGGAELYGVLLGAIGVGAVGGAFALPYLKAKLGPDRLVVAGAIGTAVALILFGSAQDASTAFVASIVAGMCWIATLSSLNVSAQLALPEWVRGRGLAIYVTVFFGAMTLGSGLWGQVAAMTDLSTAHFIAAAGALLAIPLTRRFKLQMGAGFDLTPSMHWPSPAVAADLEEQAGPVMVTVEYRVAPQGRDSFLAALELLADERRRDGAYAWELFEDTETRNRFVESFFVESWMEHLRQHERVTHADRLLQEEIESFLLQPSKVTHLLAAQRAPHRASHR